MTEQISEEFRHAMANWVEIKTQLAEARKDMKVLNDREKELKEFIKNYMKNQQIDNVNLKKGKVSLKTSTKRSSMTREAVRKGLHVYFGGDEAKVDGAIQCIVDNLETEEASVISLTGLGKKAAPAT
jgi:polyphosphate kinase 2 (PPK2 family)